MRKNHIEVLVHTGRQTAAMLEGIEEVLFKEAPDIVLVYGDTNSTIAGALAAAKLHIPVAHVEAGLRSFDRMMPEEINRVLTDHCANLLFTPTETGRRHLDAEGIRDGVFVTGDVMVDAMQANLEVAGEKSTILADLGIEPKKYMLTTVHRAENTDDPVKLGDIVAALCEIEEDVVLPCHPRTEKMLRQDGLLEKLSEQVMVIKPVGYLDMLVLEKNAAKILTDSGGVQKEAYILKVPCITLRTTSEWTETLADGWNVLVGSSYEEIVAMARDFVPIKPQSNFLGEGDAAQKIVEILDAWENAKK